MPYLITYLLKLSISLAVVFAVYWFLLRHLTFYKWNRYFLVLYSLLAFMIPFIDINSLIHNNGLQHSSVVTSVPTIPFLTVETDEVNTSAINYWMIVAIVLISGILLMAGKFVLQYLSLKKIRKSAVLLYDAGMKLYHVEKEIMPFSFGDSIYVNQHLHQQQDLKEIIRHEFIHVKDKHSIDIIFSELLCILNWYNPFAWLIRHAIRQNLEFIADHAVVENGIDRKEYQYLLLKVTSGSNFSIASNFNFSSLKKRIAMMNKQKSAQVHLLKFLLILPVVVIVLLAFRDTGILKSGNDVVTTDTLPPRAPNAPRPPEPPRLPSHVRSIHIEDDEATVRLKNGDIERYDLSNRKERNAFQQKYKALHEVPLYPSIAVEEEPTVIIDAVPSVMETMEDLPKVVMQKDYRDFLRRNDNVARLHWRNDPFRIIIELENGRKETYNLENESEVRRAESKYGRLPAPPPAPPAPPEAPAPPAVPEPPAREQGEAIVSVEPVIATGVTVAPVISRQNIVATSGIDKTKMQKNGNTVTAERITISDDAYVIAEGSVYGKKNEQVVAPVYSTTRSGEPVIVQGYPLGRKVKAQRTQPDKVIISGHEIAVAPSRIETRDADDEFTVIFEVSRNTSRERLEHMKSSLQEKGYTLKFENIDYNDGKLTALSATISRGNKKSSFNATDFGKLVISSVTRKDGEEGFHIYVYNGNLTL